VPQILRVEWLVAVVVAGYTWLLFYSILGPALPVPSSRLEWSLLQCMVYSNVTIQYVLRNVPNYAKRRQREHASKLFWMYLIVSRHLLHS
jgi:hypothetical protein